MTEQSAKFGETHLKTKLLIDNLELKNEKDYELISDFEKTNKLLATQLDVEKDAYTHVRQMVK